MISHLRLVNKDLKVKEGLSNCLSKTDLPGIGLSTPSTLNSWSAQDTTDG